jgi:hypothetical protein
MNDRDWADPDRLIDQMVADSVSRQESPVNFFREILRHYWMDNTPEEAMRLWRTTLRDAPLYAADVLNCFYLILQNPPEDLVELMQQNGWVMLFHEDDNGTLTPQSREEYLAWLRNVHAEWSDAYQKTLGK